MGNHKADQKPKASHKHSDGQYLRYDWRKAVLSEQGPPCSTCRLVLLTLNHHMDNDGYCFPGVDLVAKEARLDERTVRKHLTKACESGWLKRELRKSEGKGWRHYEYWALIPYPQGAGAAPARNNHHAGSKAEGAGLEYQEVRVERPTNLSKNYLNNCGEENLKAMREILK